MRRVHVVLAILIAAPILVGVFERRPELETPASVRMQDEEGRPDRRVHLAYWEKWGSFEADACQAMVDEFNASQDGIYVHYLRTSEVDRKAMLAIIGGDPPDVVGLWDYNLESFAEGGALMPLDDLMASAGISPDDYTPNYLKLCQHEGVTYALPTTPSSVALFYNKANFRAKAKELRAAGLDPGRAPRTIEELDRYADVLNQFDEKGKPRIIGFLHTEPGWFHSAWGLWFGGELYDPETGKITADDAGYVDAFAWAKRFAEKYGRERLLNFKSGFGTFDSPQNAFIDGRVSMVMHGVWFPNFIRRYRPHMEFGVVPFPCAEGIEGPRSILEADIIAIPRGCRHPEEAWEFVRWVQTTGLVTLCRLQGKHMPIRTPPDYFREGHPNLELDVFEEVAASPYSQTGPRISIWREYRTEIERAFEHIWAWPVPEEDLQGLAGDERQRKIEALCREEVKKTLAEVRRRMQQRIDDKREREAQRRGGDGP